MVLQRIVVLFLVLSSTTFSTATRQLKSPPNITVTGLVFCDKCFQGSLTNQLTKTIPGVQVMLNCSGNNVEQVIKQLTDKHGVFKLTLSSENLAMTGGRNCLVRVVKSPDKACHIPTNVGDGLVGVTLPEKAVELVYSVGPFAFRPEKLTCNGEELPSPTQTSPTSSSLFETIIPPLPPAIIPLPHPGFGNAPPISSSPLFPFYPPPYVFEQPTPESRWPPPPLTSDPPEIVIPPNNKPPLSPRSFPPPPPPRVQLIKPPPTHATPHLPPPPALKGHYPRTPPGPPYTKKPSPSPPKVLKPAPGGKLPPIFPAPRPASPPRQAPSLRPPFHIKPPPPARYCPPYL